jgi:sugar PTS system EIIA component
MTTVLAPVAGRVIGLPAVPDPVFAQALVGPGTAIDPLRAPATAVSPVDGQIVKLHPHAYVITTDDGRGVLVHLGIDTVRLRGAGFELLAEEGAQVTRGQPLVRWDPAAVEAGGRSPICPVIALDAAADALSDFAESDDVVPGDRLFVWT